ncbi:MAG: polysaccharide biosynthesis tyrosine autokinase [Anaerolineae bacterium]
MELIEYWNILKRWWWLMVACVLLAASSSYIGTRGMPRIYQATTTVMVGQSLQQANPSSVDLYISQQLAQTYAQMVQRQPILGGAAQALGLAYTPDPTYISTRLVAGTQLLEISVRDTIPERAQALADEIANQLILQSPTGREESERQTFVQQRLAGLEANIRKTEASIAEEQARLDAANSARAIQQYQANIAALEQRLATYMSTYASLRMSVQGGTNYISIFEHATLPSQPISPNVAQTVLLAAAIGLGLAVGGALLIEFVDDTVKSTDEVARITQLPVLGTIARLEGESYGEKLVVHHQPLSAAAEAYRALRTNIRFSFVDRPMRTLLVVSSGPSEGKSITLANLAVAMAQAGFRVIMVDTDLRRPMLHKIFNVSNAEGLSSILLAPEIDPEPYLQDTGIENLQLLPCGPIPPNPAEILGSERMGAVIDILLAIGDLIIFDSAPTLMVTDAAVLAARLREGGVLLVTDIGKTRRGLAKRAVEELQRVHANLLGVVVNHVSTRAGSEYYYYYQDYTEQGDDRSKRLPRRRGLLGVLPGRIGRNGRDGTGKLVEEKVEELI